MDFCYVKKLPADELLFRIEKTKLFFFAHLFCFLNGFKFAFSLYKP